MPLLYEYTYYILYYSIKGHSMLIFFKNYTTYFKKYLKQLIGYKLMI